MLLFELFQRALPCFGGLVLRLPKFLHRFDVLQNPDGIFQDAPDVRGVALSVRERPFGLSVCSTHGI